ncbi:MAG TPA: MMPL family transporter [Actinomycetota bacterium]
MRHRIWTTKGLAQSSVRRPKLTIALWLLGVLVAGAATQAFLGDALTTDADFTNEPEAKRANQLIEDRLRGEPQAIELLLVRSRTATVDDPAFERAATAIRRDIEALGPDVVEAVAGYYDTGEPSFVSADRDTALIRVVMAGTFDDAKDNIEQLHDVTIERDTAGFEIFDAGQATIDQDFTEISEKDLQKGELFGMPIALLVLVAVFGALVAAVIPIVLAVLAIAVAVGVTALMGTVFEFSFFVVNMITMMGLAVGIDYSLFIVSRYREERTKGREKTDAIVTASGTAGRAVFFSGMTVVLALLGMMLVPTTIFRSLATGAILVVLASVIGSMTLLPAVLSLLGDRVNKGRLPFLRRHALDEHHDGEGGFWDRAARAVMRRPVISLTLSAGLLLLAAAPVLDMHTGASGVSTLGDETQSKAAFVVLSEEFSGGLTQPAEIVIDGPVEDSQVQAAIGRLQQRLATDAVFGPGVLEGNDAGDLAVLSVPIRSDPNSDVATDAVRRLRAQHVPAAFDGVESTEVLVGGWSAFNLDFFDLTDTYTPIVFVFVLGLSFLLLMIVFRSIVVPAKAMLLNLLSVGAAYGLVVLVNQKGYGAGVLGFQQVEVIEAWLPLFLFSVLFGLSMDYHVFLLSRVKERYDQIHDNTEAVAFGVRSTAGIITGAALIMVAVFAGFAAGDLVMMQQMGFGLAVAVLIDATIVRTVLVPASMKLLGDRNWYLPRWLEWLPKVHIEGEQVGEVIDLRTAGTMSPNRPAPVREPRAIG